MNCPFCGSDEERNYAGYECGTSEIMPTASLRGKVPRVWQVSEKCQKKAKHFNQLSSAESERLSLLSEELGEAIKEMAETIQIIGKIGRHGYESRHPDGGPTNREALEKELGDVLAAIHILCERNKDLSSFNIAMARDEKIIKVGKYLHHQD